MYDTEHFRFALVKNVSDFARKRVNLQFRDTAPCGWPNLVFSILGVLLHLLFHTSHYLNYMKVLSYIKFRIAIEELMSSRELMEGKQTV